MNRWAGKVALVTGASSGIGAAIAEELVKNNVQVVGVARRVERVQSLADRLNDQPGKLHPLKCDITSEEEILAVMAWIKNNLGPISILINNAAVVNQSKLLTGDTQFWRDVFETNVLALCATTREVVENMTKFNIDGHIVNINSIAGHKVVTGNNVYSASKYAVTNLTEVFRTELRDTGKKIKMTSISPGVVNTEILQKLPTDFCEALRLVPKLEPEDVTHAVLYVLSTAPHVEVHEMIIKPLGENL